MLMNPAKSVPTALRIPIVDDDTGLLDAMQRSLRDSVRTVVACDSFEDFDTFIVDDDTGLLDAMQRSLRDSVRRSWHVTRSRKRDRC